MDDYQTVAERIRLFNEKYPDGCLQATLSYMEEPGGWYAVAYAYRDKDDTRPGIGHAFEPVPGKTPYTRDSEAMNAETSAWGRAIVALGFDTKKIASKQEVQARQTDGYHEARADAVDPQSMIVPFGKHKGKRVEDVPRAYWEWWLAQDGNKNEELLAAVELHLGLTTVAGDPVEDDIPF
jgi:uncharacterized protein (DUF3820 family)